LNDRHSRAIAPGISGVISTSEIASASIWAIAFSGQPVICGATAGSSAACAAPAAITMAATKAIKSRISSGLPGCNRRSLPHVGRGDTKVHASRPAPGRSRL
jgi:hypothetical protein